LDRTVVDADDPEVAAATTAVAAVGEVSVGILLLPMSGDDPEREVVDVVERGVRIVAVLGEGAIGGNENILAEVLPLLLLLLPPVLLLVLLALLIDVEV
jgi:hypothetical protein